MEKNRIISISVISMTALIITIVTVKMNGFNQGFVIKPHNLGQTLAMKQVSYVDQEGRRATPTYSDESYFPHSGNSTKNQFHDDRLSGNSKKCLVNILIYKNGWSLIGRKPTTYRCKNLACSFKLSYSDRPNSLKMKDIVLLYLRSKWNWSELLQVRPAGQIWIFYSRESPLHDQGIMPPSHLLHETYNWTMTYRHDATIGASYGTYIPGEPDVHENDTRNWAAGKTKMAAWMASNCHISGWQRVQFMNKFSRKYLPVDMYGNCGTLKCPKDERCKAILSKYKFYFALENSLCKEYITEKFWRNALEYGLVPIVYGAAKEDYERIAPPHSLIHLADFRSPEELVKYLETLDKNDTLYNEYFDWKKHGRIEVNSLGRTFLPKTFCKMVQKFLEIKNKNEKDVQSEMPPLKSWWRDSCNQNSHCRVVRKVLKV
ncbi:Glycoprotein 3-alpha-L-fucosyltransferase A [Holothuria leucospilota]|uniref:Fucosyltransferase n=1 Tax=Holothuria leucospilota TaxID=206669 RepID=A0A9Q1CFU2_HOLLE|nr:Glycoprotein 3-alpha-L-fucosyltransferase A [Holothuria leucospilota]